MDVLSWFQEWYSQQCDGDWEHDDRITIQSLDNPGWMVVINLLDMELEDKEFESLKIERSENDWLHCKVENKVFRGAGGAGNLKKMLEVFLSWACK